MICSLFLKSAEALLDGEEGRKKISLEVICRRAGREKNTGRKTQCDRENMQREPEEKKIKGGEKYSFSEEKGCVGPLLDKTKFVPRSFVKAANAFL